MAKKKKYSSEDLTFARRNGFNTKKPAWFPQSREKAPKLTQNNVDNFIKRYNLWVDKIKSNASEYRKKQSARTKGGKTQSERLRDQLRG